MFVKIVRSYDDQNLGVVTSTALEKKFDQILWCGARSVVSLFDF